MGFQDGLKSLLNSKDGR